MIDRNLRDGIANDIFTEAESSRIRTIITRRFNQTINEAPQDLYILASFSDPRTRNTSIYRSPNPLAAKVIISRPNNLVRSSNTSPVSYLPDSVWLRIRKGAARVLRHELELSERCPTHPLAGYDPQRAKDEMEALLVQYSSSIYPFDQPLAASQTLLEYWNFFFVRPDTRILGFIFEKLASICNNSMHEERAGSRMTYLFSALRNRTSASTMVEQIQVKQWYSLVDTVTGQPKRREKGKPVAKYRHTPLPPPATIPPTPDDALPVALDDEPDEKWLSQESRIRCRQERLADTENIATANEHLELFNLEAPALVDLLSDDVPDLEGDRAGGFAHPVIRNEESAVRRTSDVNWDD